VLRVEGVRRTYEPATGLVRLLTRTATDRTVVALDQVDLEARPGRILGLVGPNGAGKTTLIRIIAGLLDPDRGRVSVDGHDLAVEPAAASRALGLVLADDRSLYWRLTGRQ
jgi:ABC-type multidrug transport system ATPase subunit